MFSELFGPLIGLDDEWRQQGASEDEINMTAFDWDYVERIECGGGAGLESMPVKLAGGVANLVGKRVAVFRSVYRRHRRLCRGQQYHQQHDVLTLPI